MRYLLDTSTFIWFLTGNEKAISAAASDVLGNKDVSFYLSSVSIWEIAIKYSLGRLPMETPPNEIVKDLEEKSNFYSLPVTHGHAAAVANLPFHHKDPFDRLLIAQARIEDLAVLTPDTIFRKYGIKTVW